MNKSNYHSCAFFAHCLQLTLAAVWMSVSEKRVAAEAKRCRSKKIKVTARGINAFRRVYGCWRELITQWEASVGFEKTARASCSGWDTIACLPAWVRANSKASVLLLPPPHNVHSTSSLQLLTTVYSSQISFSTPKSYRTLSCTLH